MARPPTPIPAGAAAAVRRAAELQRRIDRLAGQVEALRAERDARIADAIDAGASGGSIARAVGVDRTTPRDAWERARLGQRRPRHADSD